MRDANPYQSPQANGSTLESGDTPRSKLRWAVRGFVVGAAVPVGFGLYGLAESWWYAATVSLGPNEALCGNPLPLFLIILGGPLFGFTGAMIGAVAAWASSPSQSDPPLEPL